MSGVVIKTSIQESKVSMLSLYTLYVLSLNVMAVMDNRREGVWGTGREKVHVS